MTEKYDARFVYVRFMKILFRLDGVSNAIDSRKKLPPVVSELLSPPPSSPSSAVALMQGHRWHSVEGTKGGKRNVLNATVIAECVTDITAILNHSMKGNKLHTTWIHDQVRQLHCPNS